MWISVMETLVSIRRGKDNIPCFCNSLCYARKARTCMMEIDESFSMNQNWVRIKNLKCK